MLVGYARVSTSSQSLHLQIKALEEASCNKIFTDVASCAKAARPGLKNTKMVVTGKTGGLQSIDAVDLLSCESLGDY